MATWAIAGRSTSTVIRSTWRISAAAKSSTPRMRLSAFISSRIRSNFTLRQSRISSSPCEWFVMRELSSMLPLHGAIASACLVSKLPSDASTSAEGRFANYLSPI